MEFDHVFVATARGAPEAEALIAFGLSEGDPNDHPGQGTACRRFFFQNAMLELVYLTDAVVAGREPAAPLALHRRLGDRKDGESPFGICFRPSVRSGDESHPTGMVAAPFPSFAYHPPYLPDALRIDIGKAPVTEPLWFHVPFGIRPDQPETSRRQPSDHALGVREVTAVLVTVRGAGFSHPARIASAQTIVDVRQGETPSLVLTFDGGRVGQTHDFAPALPLRFRW